MAGGGKFIAHPFDRIQKTIEETCFFLQLLFHVF